jgi:hypothetical protein
MVKVAGKSLVRHGKTSEHDLMHARIYEPQAFLMFQECLNDPRSILEVLVFRIRASSTDPQIRDQAVIRGQHRPIPSIMRKVFWPAQVKRGGKEHQSKERPPHQDQKLKEREPVHPAHSRMLC